MTAVDVGICDGLLLPMQTLQDSSKAADYALEQTLAGTTGILTFERLARPRKEPTPLRKFFVSVAAAGRHHTALWADHPWGQPS